MTLCLVLSLSPLPPPALSCLLACLNQSPARRVVGGAGGDDDSVAGVVAYLLARSRFSDAASSVSSRRAWRGAGHIRPRFRLGDLSPCSFRCLVSVAWLIPLAACFDELPFMSPVYSISLLVSSCVSSLISDGVSLCLSWFQMCFSCVFSHRSPMGLRLLDLSPRPVSSVVSSFRLVMRLGRRHDRHVLLA